METLRVSSEIKMVEGYTDRGRVLELARACDASELEATVVRAQMMANKDDDEEGNKQLNGHKTGRRFDGAAGSASSSCRLAERESTRKERGEMGPIFVTFDEARHDDICRDSLLFSSGQRRGT